MFAVVAFNNLHTGAHVTGNIKHINLAVSKHLHSVNGGSFTAQTIVNLFQRLYKLAAVQGASSHSGRRQFITELADKGVNTRVVQVLSLHKHLSTTQRYIDVNDNKLRAAIELI